MLCKKIYLDTQTKQQGYMYIPPHSVTSVIDPRSKASHHQHRELITRHLRHGVWFIYIYLYICIYIFISYIYIHIYIYRYYIYIYMSPFFFVSLSNLYNITSRFVNVTVTIVQCSYILGELFY